MTKDDARLYVKSHPRDSSCHPSIHKHLDDLLENIPHKTYILTGYCVLDRFEVDVSHLGIVCRSEVTKSSVMLIPMLGFNERGFRLGRGGGFYDKLLSNEDILKIGISESIGLVDFQEEKHDVRMDYIVTEQGILNFIQ